ncbi:MAG: nucleotidyl transferase AbiEii/AbiGii toxin family protein [Bacteroidales bacterium]
MKGLSDKVAAIIDHVSKLECIKEYVLIGGTAISLQLATRISEDLDFCKWSKNKNDKPKVNWPAIEKELSAIGIIQKIDVLDFNQVNFLFNDVKISFYANQIYQTPVNNLVQVLNNLYVADIESLGAMKIELMLRRSNFRDYYDIYSILKEGILLKEMINNARKYSNYRLSEKNILQFISNGNNYIRDKNFIHLNPKYSINEKEIEEYIKAVIISEYKKPD